MSSPITDLGETSRNGWGFRKRSWLRSKASHLHKHVPGVRKLPLSTIAIIVLLIFINVAIWAAVGIVLQFHKKLISTAAISWVLGLRHALDADHIAAIDLMTRRLIADGQKPVTVGTFFSLGHSTIVILTSIAVAATASAVSQRFGGFSHVGGIIGSSVSATFLLVLGLMNVYILVKIVQQLRKLVRTAPGDETPFKFEGGGPLFAIFKRLFRLIDRPWKMYPLGILFGLGFDTSSEIAILGIASIQATKGTSIWLILLFPLLFTAGMCMLDTIDGALMMSLYSSASLARDQIAVCYYSITLTGVTVVVAIFIGVVQFLVLGAAVIKDDEAAKPFWKGVNALGDRYDIVGASICGIFLVAGIASVLLYKPWRKRIDHIRAHLTPQNPHGSRDATVISDKEDLDRDDDMEGEIRPGPIEQLAMNPDIKRSNLHFDMEYK